MGNQLEYSSVSARERHLEKHFDGALHIGSKLFPAVKDMVLARAEVELMRAYIAAQDADIPMGHLEIRLRFDAPVGTDALARLDAHADKEHVRVIRGKGKSVTAIETDQIPETSILTIIAGPYQYGDKPAAKWGILTLHPGETSPPLDDKAFWDKHGFLATRAEIKSHMREDGKPHRFGEKPASYARNNPAR